MAVPADRLPVAARHPLHLVLLAGMLPPFVGALLSDVAYAKTEEVQWHTFAEWLLAGGLVLTAVVLVFSLVGLLRGARAPRATAYVLALAATFVVGVLGSFVHARDAWAMMPAGPLLSAATLVLALVATWLGFARRDGGLR